MAGELVPWDIVVHCLVATISKTANLGSSRYRAPICLVCITVKSLNLVSWNLEILYGNFSTVHHISG